VLKPKEFKVRSVTTIATPHRGSYFADYFLETIGKSRIPALTTFLDYMPNGGGDGKAFEGLTMEAMKKFNEEVPNVEGVEYFRYYLLQSFSPVLFQYSLVEQLGSVFPA
jgi:triacylglycerol lipase